MAFFFSAVATQEKRKTKSKAKAKGKEEAHVGTKTTPKYFIMAKFSSFIAELSSGLKGRRAETHNYRARIEIKKTMRLSFHGHHG